jgi:hypothetical protein
MTTTETRKLRVPDPGNPDFGTGRSLYIERWITVDEAARLWAVELRDYILGTTDVNLKVDEARREAFKYGCPTQVRDLAQFYCATLYRDQVICDGVRWYRVSVEVQVHVAE